MKRLFGLFCLASCKSASPLSLSQLPSLPSAEAVTQANSPLSPLIWTGSIGVLGGLILMTVTRAVGLPLRGQLPFLVGVGLIVLTYTIQKYDDYLLLPAAIAGGLVACLTVLGSFIRYRSQKCLKTSDSLLPPSSSPTPSEQPPDHPSGAG